jgi:D-arabinose 1-dehydrogenase-like Zn-dependent alcohol dehydrogenase
VIGPLGHIIKMRLASMGSGRKVVFFVAKFTPEDLMALQDLLETGKVKPFVERTYPLPQIADAMRYLGTGHVQGKLVISMAN